MIARGEHFLAPRLRDALARAGGLYTLGDVFRVVRAGKAQYWQTDDERGAIVTEIHPWPAGKAVNFWLAAGDMGAVLSLGPRIEAWARDEEHCAFATAMGRPGWSRILPGARALGTAFIKDL